MPIVQQNIIKLSNDTPVSTVGVAIGTDTVVATIPKIYGDHFLITNIVAKCVEASAIVITPSVSIGTNGATNNILTSTNVNLMLKDQFVNHYLTTQFTGTPLLSTALVGGKDIKVRLTSGASGISQSILFDIFGYVTSIYYI